MDRLHALHRAGLPHAASLAARRAVAVRRDGARLHAAAVRPRGRGRTRSLPQRGRGACRWRCWMWRATKQATLYRHKLVLSRPDQHVAWRGDAAPADALALVDRDPRRVSRGHLSRSSRAWAAKSGPRSASVARRVRVVPAAPPSPASLRFATLVRSSRPKPAKRGRGVPPPRPHPRNAGITFSANSVRLRAATSYAIGPSRNDMITPPTPIASTAASFSATVAGDP